MAVLAGTKLTRAKIAAVILSPDRDGFGVEPTFFSVPMTAEQLPDEHIEGESDELPGEEEDRVPASASRFYDVEVPRADVDVEGSSHSFHETRTDVATRGLIRDLAGDPTSALTVLVAQLFKELALQSSGGFDSSALQIDAERYVRPGPFKPIAALDGEIYARLDARREAYRASGLRPVAWVDTMAHGEKMALMDAQGLSGAAPGERVAGLEKATAEALSIRPSQIDVDNPTIADGRLKVDKFQMRGRFAMRLADYRDEEGSVARLGGVRDAFNSPFRPFVLATTSVGQGRARFPPLLLPGLPLESARQPGGP